MLLVVNFILRWVGSEAPAVPPSRLTVYGKVELHWMLIVPVASVLLDKIPVVPKFMFVALTLQLLITVAVAEDELLAVEDPVGHVFVPFVA